MIRGFMKTSSLVTLVATTGLILGNSAYAPANAADLGAGCCADLEERVAELEATTARKGNRVVSLQIYGVVSRGILFYDAKHGGDSTTTFENAELGPNESVSKVILEDEDDSYFGLRGSANLRPGWTAGYKIELYTGSQRDFANQQTAVVSVRHNHVWIESEQLGRVTLGEQSAATDGIAHIILANTYSDSGALRNDIYFNLTGAFYRDFDGRRGDFIRYDSPSIYGFILSTSWSNDLLSLTDDDIGNRDYWDVTLRYSAEFNAFRVAAGIGYTYRDVFLSDFDTDFAVPRYEEILQGSASIMHIPTGLFFAFSLGDNNIDYFNDVDQVTGDSRYWYITGGVERTFWSHGKTTFYGEYGEYDEIDDNTVWGLGVVQSFDAASLDLYAQYRNVDEDDHEPGVAGDSFDTFLLGATIYF